jgi:hypothetical protein
LNLDIELFVAEDVELRYGELGEGEVASRLRTECTPGEPVPVPVPVEDAIDIMLRVGLVNLLLDGEFGSVLRIDGDKT